MQVNIGAHKWLVIRRERLWPTDCALDSQGLDEGATLDVPLQVLVEGVPVQVEQPEVELGVHVGPELGVLLVPAEGQGVPLRLEVDGEVVVPHVGEARVHALDGLRDDVRVLHGAQGDRELRHLRDGVGPRARAVDDAAGPNALAVRLHRGDPAPGLAVHGVRLRLDRLHGAVLHEPGAQPLGRPLVLVDDAGGVYGPVGGGVHGAVDVVDVQDRIQLLGLRRGQHPAVHTIIVPEGPEPLVFIQPLLVACNEETAVLDPGVEFCLLFQFDAHIAGIRMQLDVRVGGPEPP
mmetsp:Transcript_23308/g.66320  ORF Transcript_23308/g.66320 Transcript_23308/m.66320 type:complete len:291 (-) Transcript_23308:281-1153(-)